MTLQHALYILEEMQKWRREEPPYDGDTPETHRDMPFSPNEFGQAIDLAISALRAKLETYT